VHGLGSKESDARKHYLYLGPTSETGQNGRGLRIDYPTFEASFLTAMKELKPSDIAGENKLVIGKQAEEDHLTRRLLDLDGRIEKTKRRARTAEDYDAFLDVIQDLQAERRQVSERLAEMDQEEASHPAADLNEAKTLIGLLAKAPPEQREDLRRRLKARIRQLVVGMWVLAWDETPAIRAAEVQIVFRTGKVRALLLAWNRYGKHKFVTGINAVIAEKDGERHMADKRLSNYRTDPVTREFFEGYRSTMGPAILEVVAATIKEREARNAVEDFKRTGEVPVKARRRIVRELERERKEH
jgi:hypothetical protein